MPSTDIERIKRIDAYLNDRLSQEERDAFETEMFEDEELLKEVMLLQKIDGTLHEHAGIIFEALPQPEKASHKKNIFGAFLSLLSTPVKVNITWLTWGRLAMAAAAVLIVFIVPEFLSQPDGLQQMADLTPEQAGVLQRGVHSEIVDAYQKSDYQQTIRLIEALIADSAITAISQERLLWSYRLKGFAHYFDRNYATALESFELARANSNEPAATEETWWLILQTQLKLENKPGAIAAAGKVIEYEYIYAEKARKLLEKLIEIKEQ